jgi:hypothetical protein
VYEVMGQSPSFGADHDTVTWPSWATALTLSVLVVQSSVAWDGRRSGRR